VPGGAPGGMTRAQALAAAATVIAHCAPDLPLLIDLLETAGQARLANALRAYSRDRPVEVGGKAKPDPKVWSKGRVE
jgi:hypothetical protein